MPAPPSAIHRYYRRETVSEEEIERARWMDAGYVRSKRTGRWHAVLKDADETVVSERSFGTREEVLVFLKRWANEQGIEYRPLQ
jgi:hypothetical protein